MTVMVGVIVGAVVGAIVAVPASLEATATLLAQAIHSAQNAHNAVKSGGQWRGNIGARLCRIDHRAGGAARGLHAAQTVLPPQSNS